MSWTHCDSPQSRGGGGGVKLHSSVQCNGLEFIRQTGQPHVPLMHIGTLSSSLTLHTMVCVIKSEREPYHNSISYPRYTDKTVSRRAGLMSRNLLISQSGDTRKGINYCDRDSGFLPRQKIKFPGHFLICAIHT